MGETPPNDQSEPDLGSPAPSLHRESLYQELPLKQPFDTRILTLLPAKDESHPLECKLGVITIEGYPDPYTALSYVWGPPNRTHSLECNDQEVLITETLDLALRHIRHRTKAFPLWVDQICINQNDLDERTRQVRIMRRIFARADKVISWLGPDLDSQALPARDLILGLRNTYGKRLESMAPHFPTSEQLEKLGLPSRDSPQWAAFEALLQHPYLERAWVLQEVRIGCDVRLFWGDTQICWADISGAYLHGMQYWMHMKDPDPLTSSGETPCPVLSLERLEAFMMTSLKWIDLLRATRRLRATDPRDKIFAMTGLVEEQSEMVSDYTTSLGEVYARATRQMIQTSGKLDVLAYVWIRNLDELGGVPTWAPRWDDIADVNNTPKVMADWADYSASGQTTAFLGASDNWQTLKLRGFILDTVESVASPLDSWETLENTWWKVVAESLRMAQDITGLSAADVIGSLVCTVTAGQTIGLTGLTSPVRATQHLEDFVAFAFNGLLQNWPTEGVQVCLKDLVGLAEVALESLEPNGVSHMGDDHIYYGADIDEADRGSPTKVLSFEEDEDKSQLSDGAESGGIHSGDSDNEGPRAHSKGSDSGSTIEFSDEEPGVSFNSNKENDIRESETAFSIYDESDPKRQHDDGQDALCHQGRPTTGHRTREEIEIHEDHFREGQSDEDGLAQDEKSKSKMDEKQSETDILENDQEERHPLEEIHPVEEHERTGSGIHISPQRLDEILHSFHPSDPEAAEKAFGIFNRAIAKYDTAAVIRFASQFEVSSVHRRFFITENQKRMGIGPAYMREGDVVCILHGGSTPYILRRTEGGEYLFLGESYVHGMMNGEAKHVSVEGDVSFQWFSIR